MPHATPDRNAPRSSHRRFVYYPKPTLWSNHPFALLKGDWVSPAQRVAAAELRDFLLRPEAQTKARGAAWWSRRRVDPRAAAVLDGPPAKG